MKKNGKIGFRILIELELGLDRTQYLPRMKQSYIQEGLCLSTFGL
jgi:hypothetical protein